MSKESEVFLVMQSLTKAQHKSLGTYRGWEKYTSPTESISISSQEAEELIAGYNMVLVLEDPEGRIYDLPGKKFLKKFKGWFAEQERKEREKREKMQARCALAREKKRKEKDEARQQNEGCTPQVGG